MNKRLIGAAISLVGLLAIPLVPIVASSQTGGTSYIKLPANAVTLMCRPATGNEKPSGTIASQDVVCKSMRTTVQNGRMKVPKTAGLNAAATDGAWRTWLEGALRVPLSGDGGG